MAHLKKGLCHEESRKLFNFAENLVLKDGVIV